jgi:sec-independent protein translocase protein TatA
MPFGVGPAELAILLLLALIIFGPKRLPEMGRSLGRGMREFKESVSGMGSSDDEKPSDDKKPAELPASSPAEPAATGERERDAVS